MSYLNTLINKKHYSASINSIELRILDKSFDLIIGKSIRRNISSKKGISTKSEWWLTSWRIYHFYCLFLWPSCLLNCFITNIGNLKAQLLGLYFWWCILLRIFEILFDRFFIMTPAKWKITISSRILCNFYPTWTILFRLSHYLNLFILSILLIGPYNVK